jgi:nitrite reductase/ring-hydroxylating ferredoxin subunit
LFHPTVAATEMSKHFVCEVDELPPGTCKIVNIGKASIGVMNVAGNLYSIRNKCPHRGAPLALGSVGGRMMESEPGQFVYGMDNQIWRCPWHRWQFDLVSGHSLHDPNNQRVRVYPVSVEDGHVVLEAGPLRNNVRPTPIIEPSAQPNRIDRRPTQ